MKIIAIALLFVTSVSLKSQLIGDKETLLYSFKMKSGKQVVLCSGPENSYMVYRFGTNKNIELEYPSALDNTSWQKFTYSFYLRGGGKENEGQDLNYISFENAGYRYKIFSEYYAHGNITETGIMISGPDGSETSINAIKSTIKGSLVDFRDNEKIKKEQ
jgi:hypothetical protein